MCTILEKPSSPVDMHAHAGNSFDKRMTLTVVLLTPGSMGTNDFSTCTNH